MTGVSVTCLHAIQINNIWIFLSIAMHQTCIFMINCLDKQFPLSFPTFFRFFCLSAPMFIPQYFRVRLVQFFWFWWNQWTFGENYLKCKHNWNDEEPTIKAISTVSTYCENLGFDHWFWRLKWSHHFNVVD